MILKVHNMTLKEFKIQWALGTLSIDNVIEETKENEDIYHFVMEHADPKSPFYICSVFAKELDNRRVKKEKEE